jgi:hypothetical protein
VAKVQNLNKERGMTGELYSEMNVRLQSAKRDQAQKESRMRERVQSKNEQFSQPFFQSFMHK